MIEELPKDVREEMQDIMREMDLFNTPPPHAFTLKEYYDNYINSCELKEIPEKFRLKLDGLRHKLDKMAEDGELKRDLFSIEGTSAIFYWRE